MRTRMAMPRLLRWLPVAPAGRVRHRGAGIEELAAALPPRTGDPEADARILELYMQYHSDLR